MSASEESRTLQRPGVSIQHLQGAFTILKIINVHKCGSTFHQHKESEIEAAMRENSSAQLNHTRQSASAGLHIWYLAATFYIFHLW